MALKPIGKGGAGEPSYVQGQREWGREVARQLGQSMDRTANVIGGGTVAAGKLQWRQEISFAAQWKHRAELSADRPLVVNAGVVIFPSSRTSVASAEVSLPVSGDLYVYLEINPVTKVCSIASNASIQQYDQSATSKRITLGKITEETTGAWSWTQYRQGDQFVFGSALDYGVQNGGAWVEITGEPSSGNYSWKQKDEDATTDSSPSVTGTGNLQEVSGRTGIPTGSKVWAVPNGSSGYKTEYHGDETAGGSIDALADGTASSPSSDAWDRKSQGAKRGVSINLQTNTFYNPSTGEFHKIRRNHQARANGHEEIWGAESSTLLAATTPTTNSYPYVKCSDGTTEVARYNFADLPDAYLWVYYSGAYVKAYRETLDSGTPSTPSCVVQMLDGDPGSCGALDFSAFDDFFDDSSFDTCRHTATGSPTETTKLAWASISSPGAKLTPSAPIAGDFTWEVYFSNLSGTPGGDYWQTGINLSIGSEQIQILVDDTSGVLTYSTTAGANVVDASVPTSGRFMIERIGTTFKMYWNGSEVFSQTVGTGDPTNLFWTLAPGGAATIDTLDITKSLFTGG